MMEEVRRPREGEVRDDRERLTRQLDARRIALDDLDVVPALPESSRQFRVELDCEDAAGDRGERSRKAAGSGSELDYEISSTETSAGDELGRERARAKEVLATRGCRPRAWCATDLPRTKKLVGIVVRVYARGR